MSELKKTELLWEYLTDTNEELGGHLIAHDEIESGLAYFDAELNEIVLPWYDETEHKEFQYRITLERIGEFKQN